jgi:restriction system protein
MQKASKGLFITTSYYTTDALDAILQLNGLTVVLIDGVMLCDLMIKYNLGVSIKQVYELKRIDEDYFMDE